MKVAVTCENGQITTQFAGSPQLRLYEIGPGHEIVGTEDMIPNAEGHLPILDIVLKNQVRAVICGTIGRTAYDMLKNMHVHIFAGVSGSADESIARMLDRTLQETKDPDTSDAVDNSEENCGADCSSCKYHCNG